MGFSILISAEVFKHEPKVWYLDGTIGVLIGLIIFAYGVKWVIYTVFPQQRLNLMSLIVILGLQAAAGHGPPSPTDQELWAFWVMDHGEERMRDRLTGQRLESHSQLSLHTPSLSCQRRSLYISEDLRWMRTQSVDKTRGTVCLVYILLPSSVSTFKEKDTGNCGLETHGENWFLLSKLMYNTSVAAHCPVTTQGFMFPRGLCSAVR